MTWILGIIAAFCGIGWIKQYISNAVLLWYLQEKDCPFPTQEELKRGSQWVTTHILRDLIGR